MAFLISMEFWQGDFTDKMKTLDENKNFVVVFIAMFLQEPKLFPIRSNLTLSIRKARKEVYQEIGNAAETVGPVMMYSQS